MNISKIQAMLLREEGEVLHAYKDSLGYLTIGVGHLIDKDKGGSISHDAAMFILDEDIKAKAAAAEAYPWFAGLDENRQAVVVGMIFQLGEAGFASFQGTIRKIIAHDWAGAAAGMRASKWHEQTEARVDRLADIMETGVWTY